MARKSSAGLLTPPNAGGGFVEYFWDNPAVEGDEESGSPKVSYAEGFTLPGRGQLFIVGAGIYLSVGKSIRD